jgi:hypothetical protein
MPNTLIQKPALCQFIGIINIAKIDDDRIRHLALQSDGDRATLEPTNRLFRRWVPSSWLPRRKHAECENGHHGPTGYEVMQ